MSTSTRQRFNARRVCVVPMPSLPSWLNTNKRALGIYIAGAIFAVGWWFFLDACTLSSRTLLRPVDPDTPFEPPPVRINFADWVPGLLSTLGMIVVNLIDKSHLAESGGAFSFGGGAGGGWGGDGVQWRARLFLFIGFALLAGGLAGSVTVLVVKYLVPVLPEGYDYYGVSNVLQNGAIMVSTVLLWTAQQAEQEYEYHISI
ncbi:hypothetical protein CF327_g70 [Tilletia walkeri]|nr:hypothetical protein CF327_g70 [Tilletia walkeri]